MEKQMDKAIHMAPDPSQGFSSDNEFLWTNIACKLHIIPHTCGRQSSCINCPNQVPQKYWDRISEKGSDNVKIF